ncbi:AraC family transcriptional regulator [Devosia sp. H5989]|nr:AraC family transcriptional regulator [Devosia sp. H5989]
MQSPVIFSTQNLSKSDQFDAYREFMAPVIDVAAVGDPEISFQTQHTVWNMGATVLTRAVLPPMPRRFSHLRKDPLDHWCLVLCETGEPQARGEGDPVRLTGRQMGIRSLGRPFETTVTDRTVLSLYIPRDLFPSAAGVLDAADGQMLGGVLTDLLADYLAALERRLPLIGIEETARIAEATGNIIAACLAPTADRLDAARPAANWTLVERARRAIQQNLATPEFTPEELCRKIGTSRSKLYRLFEPFGGVAHYMQRQRLREARSMLSRSDEVLSVSRIGEMVGFADLSSFSRAFRREFGASPSDMRGIPVMSATPLEPRPSIADSGLLGSALRSLHG